MGMSLIGTGVSFSMVWERVSVVQESVSHDMGMSLNGTETSLLLTYLCDIL